MIRSPDDETRVELHEVTYGGKQIFEVCGAIVRPTCARCICTTFRVVKYVGANDYIGGGIGCEAGDHGGIQISPLEGLNRAPEHSKTTSCTRDVRAYYAYNTTK